MPRLRPRAVLTAQDLPKSTVAATAADGSVARTARPSAQAAQTDPGQAGYLGRLITYIPGEIIAAHQVLIGLFPLPSGRSAQAWIGGLLIVLTFLWTRYSTKEPGEQAATHQVIISTLAFVVWLYATHSALIDVLGLPWTANGSTAVLIVAAGLVFPLIEAFVASRRRASAAAPAPTPAQISPPSPPPPSGG